SSFPHYAGFKNSRYSSNLSSNNQNALIFYKMTLLSERLVRRQSAPPCQKRGAAWYAPNPVKSETRSDGNFSAFFF
ncbi:MAG: hypothetical protein LBF93_03085, partial [Zoogloeaceae bacterium]|nr:hypothetical protein [Zoogloeaceae bacterium]